MFTLMFKKAHAYNNNVIFYFDAYDHKYVAQNGSLAWRLNNPGLLHIRSLKEHSNIGSCDTYAIFSFPEIGLRMLKKWLKSKKSLTAIAKYYESLPDKDFLKELCEATKLQPSTKIKSLSNEKFQLLVKSILKLCNSSFEGSFALLPKISARYYAEKPEFIELYLTDTQSLLSKEESIQWIDSHRLDAVIVHKNNGTLYLRSRPGHHLDKIHFLSEECKPEIEFNNSIETLGDQKPGQPIWGFINGIWNDRDFIKDSLSSIVSAANGEQVWALANITKSKLKDFLEILRQKDKSATAIVDIAVQFFQLLIDFSIKQSDPPPIIIFTHSQGAIIADLALNMLKNSERQKLRIFTLGGVSLIAPGKAHPDSHNYISAADIIPRHLALGLELTNLALRRYESQKNGLTQDELIDILIEEDIDNELDTQDPETILTYSSQRKEYYLAEFAKISNVTILDPSVNATFNRYEHELISPCYQRIIHEIIKKYHPVFC